MNDGNRQRVRRAFDDLKPYVETYVERTLAEAKDAARLERSDSAKLIGIMLQHWDTEFASRHPATVRHCLFEIKDVRNRWAHEEPFSEEETRRAEDAVRLVARLSLCQKRQIGRGEVLRKSNTRGIAAAEYGRLLLANSASRALLDRE